MIVKDLQPDQSLRALHDPLVKKERKKKKNNVNNILLSIITIIIFVNSNFAIGVSYSISKRHISLASNFAIALVNAITTMVTMLLGNYLTSFMSPSVASFTGASIFITLGLKDLFSFFYSSYTENFPDEKSYLFHDPVQVKMYMLWIFVVGVKS